MHTLIPHLRSHFDSLQDRLATFYQEGVQLEGWFKGEMLFTLDQLRKRKVLRDFDREVRFETARRRTIDLKVALPSGPNWVELKYWLVGPQKGRRYDPLFYFQDHSSVGIIRDVKKLRSIQRDGHLWLLILSVTDPTLSGWTLGFQRFREKFCIDLATDCVPTEHGASHFLSLIRIPRA